MEPTDLHQTIAQQIDHMKPADLRPGIDVGMDVLDATTLLVRVLPAEPNDARSLDARITYNEGRDLYDVVIAQRGETTEYEGVFCDTLGELVFKEDAQPWTLPFGALVIEKDDGSLEIREF